MTYPIKPDTIEDSWTRGRVDMFAKFVEYRNRHPEAINEDVIRDIYHNTLENQCKLELKFAVTVKGEEITE